MTEYHIYGLICPIKNVVRYIGVSSNPKARCKQHLLEAIRRLTDASNSYGNLTVKDAWLCHLMLRQLTPDVSLLANAHTIEDALAKEAILIQQYSGPYLTNIIKEVKYTNKKRDAHITDFNIRITS